MNSVVVYFAFIDVTEVFDTDKRQLLWYVLSKFELEMGIEPNNKSSGSVRVRLILSSGSVRFDQLYGSGSVKVQLQLRIWFGHNCTCKKLDAPKKSNPTHVIKSQTNHTDSRLPSSHSQRA